MWTRPIVYLLGWEVHLVDILAVEKLVKPQTPSRNRLRCRTDTPVGLTLAPFFTLPPTTFRPVLAHSATLALDLHDQPLLPRHAVAGTPHRAAAG